MQPVELKNKNASQPILNLNYKYLILNDIKFYFILFFKGEDFYSFNFIKLPKLNHLRC